MICRTLAQNPRMRGKSHQTSRKTWSAQNTDKTKSPWDGVIRKSTPCQFNSGVKSAYVIFTSQAKPELLPSREISLAILLGVNIAYADFTPPQKIMSLTLLNS